MRRPTRLRLERLVGDALPVSGTAAVSGSMLLRRSPVLPPFVMHVKPVDVPQPDYGARHVAAMVLIVEPGRQRRVDPDLMARTLELTRPESQVAVWLAEGKTVRDMAQATGHTERAIYWHLRQIYQKQSISRQVDPGAVGAVARRTRMRGGAAGTSQERPPGEVTCAMEGLRPS